VKGNASQNKESDSMYALGWKGGYDKDILMIYLLKNTYFLHQLSNQQKF